ncbi:MULTISPECIES: diguanylate cyclase [Pseudanabaena]|uniref:Response regulator receiver modulated diguanylate cyclase n=2 Tax=Pseudanabaena TaxID=1152 RepID=L8N0X6_9CYAN|nr:MULTISPECIES: diguanylate cyclase [Pseudanabaena]ELS32724.1 response regulator receiver modulated diguanylate cyclase [Pseudanabaena biceps PCC 7429]MDG3495045.1 diguanylate cyclase [Pseudanabaena catenata USMAC16]
MFGKPKSLPNEPLITVLLIDDQAIIGEAVRRMLLTESDIIFHFCSDPSVAIQKAIEVAPTVILQDLVMPEIDGLMLLKFFRANVVTRDIPMIVLSSKEEVELKAEAFAIGANDYLIKLPDKIELIARIRYHSRAYINLLQRDEAYQAIQDYLKKLEIERRKVVERTNELAHLNVELERIASIDMLTGVANRRQFMYRLEQEIERSRRYKRPLSLIALDIDHFKKINDAWGHGGGDIALYDISQRVNLLMRESDLLGRIGGEEFVVLLTETSSEEAMLVAERLRSVIADTPVVINGNNVNVTASFGVATFDQEKDTITTILSRADKALYMSKETGRNRVVVANI